MNVLLLTYSFNYNYGGLLQAYATVKYLGSLGHQVTVPVSHPQYLVGNTAIYRGLGLRRGNPFASIFRRLRQFTRYRRFDDFRKALPLDASLSSKQDIARSISRFDVVLTGSDQTWNTKFMPAYDSYFYQGFFDAGARKVSYASCFGTREQNEAVLAKAAPDLRQFDSIAVRNEVSRGIVSDLAGRNPSVVVDPTLLHDFSEFRRPSAPSGRAPFVMVYALDNSNFISAERVVRELRKREPSLEVHFVNGEKNFDKPAWATHLINNYGPKEFLEAMQDSRYVVTDSFHGVIFAQKFDCPCIVYTSGWRSERIVSIMEDFEARDLLLLDADEEQVSRVVSTVMSSGSVLRIGEALKRRIEDSKQYLQKAIGPQ